MYKTLVSIIFILLFSVTSNQINAQGCVYENALNYDPSATEPNSSCVFAAEDFGVCIAPATPISFCLDLAGAGNKSLSAIHSVFDCSITIVSASCFEYLPLPALIGTDTLTIQICDDSNQCQAIIVSPFITPNFSSCAESACLQRWDYNECACVDLDSNVSGCTDPNAENFNPDATCEDESCVEEVIVSGIEDHAQGVYAVLYGNDGELNVQLLDKAAANNLEYYLFNVNGALVKRGILKDDYHRISIENSNPGLYILRTVFGSQRVLLR